MNVICLREWFFPGIFHKLGAHHLHCNHVISGQPSLTMKSQSRKVCLLGEFAVGKTSTVARSVRNTFSELYLTTVGVKVDSKTMQIEDLQLRLVLWDIAGAGALDQLRQNYIVGTHGMMLVADGTREDTVTIALQLREQVSRLLGRAAPAVLLLN